jgi:hypothetical protein
VLDPNTSYTLHIYNGGKNNQFKGKVSSAVIQLNGVDVVRPNEFNQKVSHIEKPIRLSKDNKLSVEIRSQPGSGITIEIIGVDNDPPTIVATLTPSPNAAGWNNTDVMVSFVCSDTMSGIAFCPSPVQMDNEGADQVVTGTAMDNAGNSASVSVAVNIDKTPPVVTIISPLPGANLQEPAVNVQGTVSDALSGVATVTCNGMPASLTNGSFICDIALVEGDNDIATEATDLAGNTGSSNIMIAYVPPALELAYIDQFEPIIWLNGIGGYSRPVIPTLPPGFYSLGHYGEGDFGTPRGFVLAARELELGALAGPADYIGLLPSGGWPPLCSYQIWRPVPPPGYFCLGQLIKEGTVTNEFPLTIECLKPSTDEMRCVRQDLTVPAKVGNSIMLFPYKSIYLIPTWQIIPADENGVMSSLFCKFSQSLYSQRFPLVPLKRRPFAF